MMRICLVCGQPFKPKTPHQKFCSIECQQQYGRLSPNTRQILWDIFHSNTSITFGELVSKYGLKSVISTYNFLKSKGIHFEIEIR